MYTNINTCITLEQFALSLGLGLYGMVQVDIGDAEFECSDILYQTDKLRSYSSRDSLSLAIAQVESIWRDNIGYSLAPVYEEKFKGIEVPYKSTGIRVKMSNMIQSVGSKSRTSIGDFAIAVSGDTWTVDFEDIVGYDEYEVYYVLADRGNEPISSIFSIKPFYVEDVDATNRRIHGRHVASVVKPASISGTDVYDLADVASILAAEVEVYGVSISSTDFGTIHYLDGTSAAITRLSVPDADLGWVYVSSPTNGDIVGVTLKHTHGLPLDSRGMVDHSHAVAVSQAAVGYLHSLEVGCDTVRDAITYFGTPPSADDMFGRKRPITMADIDNIFGEHTGALALRNFALSKVYPV